MSFSRQRQYFTKADFTFDSFCFISDWVAIKKSACRCNSVRRFFIMKNTSLGIVMLTWGDLQAEALYKIRRAADYHKLMVMQHIMWPSTAMLTLLSLVPRAVVYVNYFQVLTCGMTCIWSLDGFHDVLLDSLFHAKDVTQMFMFVVTVGCFMAPVSKGRYISS